jgi:hypothetical protein
MSQSTSNTAGLNISFVGYNGSTISAPVMSALESAASFLHTEITNPINLTIGVNILAGAPATILAEGQPSPEFGVSLSRAEQLLSTNDPGVSLPATLPQGAYNEIFMSQAEDKALGIPLPQSYALDGVILINPSFVSDFNMGVAVHEITHVMGRTSNNTATMPNGQYEFSPLNLFRFTSPGTLEVSGANLGHGSYNSQNPYFSTDNGATQLQTFRSPGGADWLSPTYTPPGTATDMLNYVSSNNNTIFSSADKSLMQAIGFAVAGAASTPTPPPVTLPASYATIIGSLGTGVSSVLGATVTDYQMTMSGGNFVTITGNSNAVLADQAGSDTILATGSGSVFGYNQSGYAGLLDFINTGSAPAVINDLSGSMTMQGGAGGGTVRGGTGGNNSIIGGSGALYAVGGGDSSLVVVNSPQTNYLFAGIGNETLIANPGTGTNLFDCNPGAGGDVMISQGTGTQYFFGSAGTSTMTGSTVAGSSNVFFMGSSIGGASVVVTNFGQINGTIDTVDNAVIQSVTDTSYNGAASALVTLNDGTRITLLGVSSASLNYTTGGTSLT